MTKPTETKQDTTKQDFETKLQKKLEDRVVSKAKDKEKAKEWFRSHVIITKA